MSALQIVAAAAVVLFTVWCMVAFVFGPRQPIPGEHPAQPGDRRVKNEPQWPRTAQQMNAPVVYIGRDPDRPDRRKWPEIAAGIREAYGDESVVTVMERHSGGTHGRYTWRRGT